MPPSHSDNAESVKAVPRWMEWLFLVTGALITVTLALGATVCATDASASCPNWPGCYVGRLTPQAHTQPVIEFVHRVISSSIGLFGLASVVAGWFYRRRSRMLVVLPLVALLCALVSAVFGMMTIRWGINKFEAALDLLAALVSMGAMWRAWFVARHPGDGWHWNARVRLGMGTVGALIAGHFLAVLVSGSESLTRCMGWALFTRGVGDGPLWAWILQQAVMTVGEAATILLIVVRLRHRANAWDLLLAVLVALVVVVGVLISVGGANDGLAVTHAVGTVLVLNLVMTGTMRDSQA